MGDFLLVVSLQLCSILFTGTSFLLEVLSLSSQELVVAGKGGVSASQILVLLLQLVVFVSELNVVLLELSESASELLNVNSLSLKSFLIAFVLSLESSDGLVNFVVVSTAA